MFWKGTEKSKTVVSQVDTQGLPCADGCGIELLGYKQCHWTSSRIYSSRTPNTRYLKTRPETRSDQQKRMEKQAGRQFFNDIQRPGFSVYSRSHGTHMPQ